MYTIYVHNSCTDPLTLIPNHCVELIILTAELFLDYPKYSFYHEMFSSRSTTPARKWKGYRFLDE